MPEPINAITSYNQFLPSQPKLCDKPRIRNDLLQTTDDDLADILCDGVLTVPDIILTYLVRYNRLWEKDINQPDRVDEGSAINWFSNHHGPALGLTACIFLISLANANRIYQKKLVARHNEDPQYLYSVFVANSTTNKDDENNAEQKLRDYFNKSYQLDAALNTKYKTEPAQANNSETKKESVIARFYTNAVNKFFYPVWQFLGLSSFAFWILWIGGSLFSGRLDNSVTGLSPWFAFGIPVGVGLVYPVVRVARWVVNWVVNKYSSNSNKDIDQQAKPENTKVTCSLLRRAILRQKIDNALEAAEAIIATKTKAATESDKIQNTDEASEASVPNKTQNNTEILLDKDNEVKNTLGKNKVAKVLLTGISRLVGGYIAAQYCAWIVVAFLAETMNIILPGLNLVGGIILMAIAGIYAVAKAYQRYQALNKEEQATKTLNKEEQATKTLTAGLTTSDNQEEARNDLREEITSSEPEEERNKLLEKITGLENKIKDLLKPTFGQELNSQERNIRNQLESSWNKLRAQSIPSYTQEDFFENVASKLPVDAQDRIKERQLSWTINWTNFKKLGTRGYELINGFCTGAFLARIFFVKNSAIFLPFGAISIVNPWITMIIISCIGLAFGILKTYEYSLRRKEERLNAYHTKRQEYMECLMLECQYYPKLCEAYQKLIDQAKRELDDERNLRINTPSPTASNSGQDSGVDNIGDNSDQQTTLVMKKAESSPSLSKSYVSQPGNLGLFKQSSVASNPQKPAKNTAFTLPRCAIL